MAISIRIGGGAASIPAASTSTAGKVRLATNTEAVTGTATDIAVTPAGVAAALAGVVGGMTYKGFWDAVNAVPDLSNAKQGDFYYISAAGTRYGKTWNVGDHLVVNANMGGTIDGAKLDKIDSTEMVSNLGDLLDVTLTSPTNGQALTYDAATSQWVNSTLDISALQSEINTTQTGAGLNTDGTYSAPASSNYLSTATSLKSADSLLDAAIAAEATARANAVTAEATSRANADTTLQNNITAEATSRANADTTLQNNITAEATSRANADTALQNELDATQTGAGLNTNGTYSAPASSNYLSTATSLKSADSLLDAQIKSVADDVATLGGSTVVSVNSILPVAGNVTLTATDISGFATVATSGAYADISGTPSLATVATSGAGADVTIAHTAVNYTAATTSLESHIAGIDTQLGVGLVTSVNSVAPVGGNVTLTATDISGFATVATSGAYADLSGKPNLATVATSGAYADLSGKPTLATVATSGAYADLSGKPTLATVATSGAADDVSVAAIPTSYTAASADVEAHLVGIDTQLGVIGGSTVVSVNSVAPVAGDVTLTAQDIDTSHTAINYTAAGSSVTEHIAGIDGELGTIDTALQAVVSDVADLTANRLHASIEFVNNGVNDVQAGIDAATASNTLVWCSPGTYGGATVTITNKELLKLRAEGCGTGAFGIVELTARGITLSGASSTRNLVQGFQVEGLTTINGTQGRHAFVDCQLLGGLSITNGTANFVTIRDCDIAGSVTIAATVTAVVYFINCNFAAGASVTNSALATQVIVANCGGFPAAALTSVTMAGQSGLSDGSFRGFFSALSLPAALSFTGNTNQLTNGAGFITAATAPVTSVNTLTGAVTLTGQNTNTNHTATNYTAATTALTSHLAGIDTVLGTLGGSTVATVNGISPVGGNVTVTATDITGFATVATSGAYADLSGAPTLATVATSGAYADISGTPTLATVATSGAYADLSGTPTLATVATSGAYADLSGTPTLGSAAAEDVGTAVGDVVQLVDVGAGVAGLPAIDGSNITGLDYTNLTNVPTSFISSLEYITTQTPLTLVAGKHYIMANATDTLKVLTVPDSANGGDIIRITNWGLGRLKLTTGGGNTTFLLSGLDVVGGSTAGEVFVESKCTVDLVGFDYSPAGLLPAWGVYFISSIEINTKGLTTSGQAIVYNATTKKLEGGSAGDFASGYTPTNYTAADSKFDSQFAGIDTELGLKAATADVLLSANNLSDLASAPTARTNLGLGTAAVANTGTAAGNVVVLADVGGVVKLPAVDGSQLTNLPATSAALDDLTDVVITSPVNGQALVYNNATSQWVNGSTTGDLIDVTSASPSGTYTITSQAGVQEVYLLTLGANTTVTIPSASGPGAGYVYVIKNMSSFTMTITPSSGTIDGSASFASSVQYAAISLVSDGTNWFII